MTISELLEGLVVIAKSGPLSAEIKGIAYDSRSVKEGYLFVAVRGFNSDGHDYIIEAMNRGAAAVVSEKAAANVKDADLLADRRSKAFIEVPDSREALARLSAVFYGMPSSRLSLVGITGTNGKTTTSFLTRSIIEAAGRKSGLIGTICYITGERMIPASHTTPESLDLQRCLSEMVNSGMEYAVLEVSSHALDLKRTAGCSFAAAAFTNFSQDHLDYHGSMEAYFRAKASLFDQLAPGGSAVLNRDDARIRELAGRLDRRVITCGLEEGAMIRAENIEEIAGGSVPAGTAFDITTPESRFRIESRLIGRFNIYNILLSAGIAYSLGIGEEDIRKGIRDARPVQGRFESVDEGQDFLCIVDYAHTDDALRKLIQSARPLTRGKLITVFGCGGNRDRGKRPLMGAVASGLSDLVIVTSDNPRNEDPLAIIDDIVQGIQRGNSTVIPDRREAIREAVSAAKAGDTVLVAGKGHEDYQEIRGKRYHFSDREVLREEIGRRSSAGDRDSGPGNQR